jgi:hypothetical protein
VHHRPQEAARRPHYKVASVRVRLPDGLMLQGQFGAQEAVGAIAEWVSESLAEPSTPFQVTNWTSTTNPLWGLQCRKGEGKSRRTVDALSGNIGRVQNKVKLLMSPRILILGVVRNLKATHSPPLDWATTMHVCDEYNRYFVGSLISY